MLLWGMQVLTGLSGYLFIFNNTLLTSVGGAFASLTYVSGGLALDANGFPNITQSLLPRLLTVGGPLDIANNPMITAMSCAFPVSPSPPIFISAQ